MALLEKNSVLCYNKKMAETPKNYQLSYLPKELAVLIERWPTKQVEALSKAMDELFSQTFYHLNAQANKDTVDMLEKDGTRAVMVAMICARNCKDIDEAHKVKDALFTSLGVELQLNVMSGAREKYEGIEGMRGVIASKVVKDLQRLLEDKKASEKKK